MTTNPSIWSLAERASDSLEVYLLGLVDFEAALFLQERLVYEIAGRNDSLGGLLLCEHPPLVTVGREGSRSHILVEPRELVSRQIDVRWLNRGGGCVLHAPGQLAVYPIVPLDRLGFGLAEFRRRLETAAVQACRDSRIPAERRDDAPGIWCHRGQLGHTGVAVKSWISYHGLFLNVSPALPLQRLVRSNRHGEPVTSLSCQREHTVAMHKVRENLIHHLASQLGYDRMHLYTGHPLLRRTRTKAFVSA